MNMMFSIFYVFVNNADPKFNILSVNLVWVPHEGLNVQNIVIILYKQFGKSLGLLVELFLFVLRTILLFIKVFYTKVYFVFVFLLCLREAFH